VLEAKGRTLLMMLQGRLVDNFVRCSDKNISLNSQIHNKVSLLYLSIERAACPTPTSAFPLGKIKPVPIKRVTFAELRHTVQCLTDHIIA
jgi:hypothetical protein